VRVWNRVNLREQFGGSGVWVDFEGYQWVVSCFHTFSDGVGKITVTNSDGTISPATLAAYDRIYDVSVLIAEPPTPKVCVKLADELPQPGNQLLSCGFGGPREGFAVNRGRFTQFVSPGSGPGDWLELSGTARQGDSGGPIYTADGQLCGVLFGTDGRRVNGASVGRVRLTLELAMKALKLKRAMKKTSVRVDVGRVNVHVDRGCYVPPKVVKKKTVTVKKADGTKIKKRTVIERGPYWRSGFGQLTQYQPYLAMQPPTPARGDDDVPDITDLPRSVAPLPGPISDDEAERTGISKRQPPRTPTPAAPKTNPKMPWREGSQDRDVLGDNRDADQDARIAGLIRAQEAERAARLNQDRQQPTLAPADGPVGEPTPLGVTLILVAALVVGVVLFYVVGKN
jgi:hypothetical protein